MSRDRNIKKTHLPSLIVAELFFGIAATTASFVVFLQMATSITALQALDVSVSHFFIMQRTPLLTQVMLAITLLGNQVLVVLLVIVALILVLKKHGRDAVVFVLIVSIGIALNLLLKEIIARARPDSAPLVHEQFYSFPSGHVMNSFVFYSSVALYIYRHSQRRVITVLVIAVCTSVVFLIGISRIYLGVHYPTDVLAGLIAGFWWMATALVIEKSLYLYTRFFQSTA